MKKIALIMIAIAQLLAVSCSSQKKEEQAPAASKTIVLYYSQTGATEAVAKELQSALGADIEAIELVEPYSGTYEETIKRCMDEKVNGIVPAIKPLAADIAAYDTVFLGYPVWFGTYATPIKSLIDSLDFAGKKVVPFCTFGSGGIEATTEGLRKALPKAEVEEGYGVRNARIADAPAEIHRWLVEAGYVDGEVEALPEFSAPQPVTKEEADIFQAACGSYQFPLGTPVEAGKRELGDGAVEYQFIAESTAPDGSKAMSTIYVLAGAGAEPVFTRVVR